MQSSDLLLHPVNTLRARLMVEDFSGRARPGLLAYAKQVSRHRSRCCVVGA